MLLVEASPGMALINKQHRYINTRPILLRCSHSCIVDAATGDCVCRFSLRFNKRAMDLGQVWAVINLGNSCFIPALSQRHPRSRSMCQHVSSDGLLRIGHKCHCCARVGHHLVCDEDGDVVFFGDADELGKHLIKTLLSFPQLASSRKVRPEQAYNRIDDLVVEKLCRFTSRR